MKELRALCVLAVAAGLRAEAAQTPNIVVILSDDYGYGSAVCYGANPRLIQTPAIDRLAQEGMRFTQAHTPNSVCTPTRYAVLTGRYCWRTKLNEGNVLNTSDPLLIETSRPTISAMLKSHGYQAAMIGKWHLGYGTKPKVDYTGELNPGPLELGFDYQFAVPQNQNDTTRVYVENHKVYGLRSTKLTPEKGKLGLDAPERDDPKVMGDLTDHAVDWIGQQTADKPFFLYFTPVAVHEVVSPSAETSGTSKAGPYGDYIHDLDISVRRILEKLDEMKVAENTLIIFTSDNGGVIGKSKSNASIIAMDAGLKINGDVLRGGKHDIWEGGFRVPFIVRWPGNVAAGSTSDQIVSLVDIFATLADVLHEPLPAPADGAPDSYTMLPVLLGTGVTERPDLILQSAKNDYAFLKGPWKLVLPAPDKKTASRPAAQLYNLEKDPGEQKDVARNNPEVVSDLSKLLKQQREQPYSRN